MSKFARIDIDRARRDSEYLWLRNRATDTQVAEIVRAHMELNTTPDEWLDALLDAARPAYEFHTGTRHEF